MMRLMLFCALIFLLAACGSGQPDVNDEAVQTALVVIAAERTREAEATAGATLPAPPTEETSPAPTSTDTEQAATAPHADGLYLVGVDIAPGLWRSTASDQRFCYWARRKYDGIILASYYGLPGGELRLQESDYEVELDGCGTWIYLGP